ncbi:hypothetical protein EHS25_009295 [Saitozyma podzolica]|uniref:THO complex subunit 5 n=1 Tax=Saitozyma podzolica TaxID=1890683 RepID=A0A427YLF3_9TREE|nr:hypothetical protein EHS25_009295 [Saitozyma podzolica]
MVLPSSISDPSPLDPLLLVPLPAILPTSPLPSLPPLISALDSHLTTSPTTSPNNDALPIPLLTTQMRQVTRSGQVLLNAARHGAAEAREGLDRVDVELRGVEYERERVREEIALCGDYAPKYAELDLPDVDTFLHTASAEELAKLPSQDEEGYEHALTIARLEHELAEIEKREAIIAQLTRDRDALIKSKREIKMKFDAVESYLVDHTRMFNAVSTRLKEIAKLSGPQLSAAALGIVPALEQAQTTMTDEAEMSETTA